MKIPAYHGPTISSPETLAELLSINVIKLTSLSDNASHYYHPNTPVVKPNGGTRQTYRVEPGLEIIQTTIHKIILQAVDFPEYICAVKDDNCKRDFVADAMRHRGSSISITADIKSFFPSIRYSSVMRLWQGVCRFPEDVATILTKLTAYNGVLPQGAKTSPYIASLIFWDREPQLEESLRNSGYRYSRYLDDTTISSISFVPKKDIQPIVSKVYGMWASIGAKPDRGKFGIATSGNRQSVHGLNMNSGKPTVSKGYRKNVRAAVHALEGYDIALRGTPEYIERYAQVEGQIAHIKRCNPSSAEKLLDRLHAIAPLRIDFNRQ